MKKCLQIALSCALGLAALSCAYAQGTFQNLNFEAAQLIPIPGDINGAVHFDAAFPGWTGYLGNQQATSAIPNGLPISFTYNPFIVLATPYAMQGNYMVTISGGYGYPPSPNWTPASIAQTGTIPAYAKSIKLLTNQPNVPGAGAGLVRLDGVAVQLYHLGSTANYGEMWGGDISSSAGQLRELRLFGGWTSFDDITFSPSPIPEPGGYELALFAGALLLWKRGVGAQSTNHPQHNSALRIGTPTFSLE